MTSKQTLWVAYLALLISLSTWTLDWLHIVEPCPYCRVQRTVIGLLGILLLLPIVRHWTIQILAKAFAAFGIVVGATQHFNGWMQISKGQFDFSAPIYSGDYLHFLLSGAALIIIVMTLQLITQQGSPDTSHPLTSNAST